MARVEGKLDPVHERELNQNRAVQLISVDQFQSIC